MDSESQAYHDLRHSFRSKTVDMYFQILKYQIYLFRQYGRAGIVRFLRDVVVADDWVSLRGQIEKSRHSIDNDLREIDGKTIGDIDRTMSALREKAEKFMESLSEIQVAVEVGTTFQHLPHASTCALDQR
jgi:hypothetical protein